MADEKTEKPRLDFEFVGTTNRPLSLDPEEFKGWPVQRVEAAILDMLKSIAPDVSFFPDDIALAAVALSDAAQT